MKITAVTHSDRRQRSGLSVAACQPTSHSKYLAGVMAAAAPSRVMCIFRPWQIVTYSFLHDIRNIYHLAFNMFALWMFGAEIERYVGPRRLLACYFASVVTAALSQLFVPVIFGAPPVPTIGASGGVFGLLLAYAVLFPTSQGHSLDSADSHAGVAVRHDLCVHRAFLGRDRNAVRRCAFRSPGRHGRQRAWSSCNGGASAP